MSQGARKTGASARPAALSATTQSAAAVSPATRISERYL
jgi:hypothetical protein